MGAFGSLLMATMVRDPFIPTRCWMAPEMPIAMYNLGPTVCPELPTWRSIGSQPASQMGRAQIHGARRFPEPVQRPGAHVTRRDGGGKLLHHQCAFQRLVRAVRSGLEGNEVGRVASEPHVGVHFALE